MVLVRFGERVERSHLLCARLEGLQLRRGEQVRELLAHRASVHLASEPAQVRPHVGLERLADEVPDHRAELRLLAEAHPVVDDVDPPVLAEQAMPGLRSALFTTRSKAATRWNSLGKRPARVK